MFGWFKKYNVKNHIDNFVGKENFGSRSDQLSAIIPEPKPLPRLELGKEYVNRLGEKVVLLHESEALKSIRNLGSSKVYVYSDVNKRNYTGEGRFFIEGIYFIKSLWDLVLPSEEENNLPKTWDDGSLFEDILTTSQLKENEW